ncbi:hypothetical protein FJZ26_06290 [Candidatus Parvarchaeota archaeon]|nr:hypothetical protein [Candidatus Parvarchaeota archaeon]
MPTEEKKQDLGKQDAKDAAKKQAKPGAPVCVGCLRWEKFGESCWVYWEGKKFCTMKVNSVEDWKNMEQ